MVTSKQQRRADKKRRAAAARQEYQRQAAGAFTGRGSGSSVRELIDLATQAASAGPSFAGPFEECIDRLVDADGLGISDGSASVDVLLDERLTAAIRAVWEIGWQPLDVVHVIRRSITPRAGKLLSFMVRAEATRSDRFTEMPDEWADQLVSLGDRPTPAQMERPLLSFARAEKLGRPDLFADAIRVQSLVTRLPRIGVLGDPPSRWSTSRVSRPVGENRTASAKTLATIRALLAKAEGTTFPAEAETFAAKAQELMTRHSIDAALLDARHGDDLVAGVRSRRLHLDNPYAKEKYHLLATVARVNNVRVVYTENLGFATAVGFPADLDVIDLLFTSLLVQAARALTEASAVMSRGSAPSFRRGFWIAYAVRIGERLEEARQHASTEAEATYGTSLVPVMAERTAAVDSVTKQLFARTSPMKTRSVDAQGWHAGRAAADLANLDATKGRLAQ